MLGETDAQSVTQIFIQWKIVRAIHSMHSLLNIHCDARLGDMLLGGTRRWALGGCINKGNSPSQLEEEGIAPTPPPAPADTAPSNSLWARPQPRFQQISAPLRPPHTEPPVILQGRPPHFSEEDRGRAQLDGFLKARQESAGLLTRGATISWLLTALPGSPRPSSEPHFLSPSDHPPSPSKLLSLM